MNTCIRVLLLGLTVWRDDMSGLRWDVLPRAWLEEDETKAYESYNKEQRPNE